MGVSHVLAASVLYAGVRSVWAWADAASPECVVPVIVPGGKPVGEMPGLLTPRSPVRAVAPVLVTAEAPSTTKLWAVLRAGAVGLAEPVGPVTVDFLSLLHAPAKSAAARSTAVRRGEGCRNFFMVFSLISVRIDEAQAICMRPC